MIHLVTAGFLSFPDLGSFTPSPGIVSITAGFCTGIILAIPSCVILPKYKNLLFNKTRALVLPFLKKNSLGYQIYLFYIKRKKARKTKKLADSDPKIRRSDYFYRKKSFFELHTRQYDVVMIGDSITDEAEWEDLFPSVRIANRGIGGDTTDGVIERMNSILSTNASKAFIMIGINDFLWGVKVDHVFENYRTIVNQLISHGIETTVQSTVLAGKPMEHLNAKIVELNSRLEKLAEAESITFIDLNQALAKEALLDPQYSRDGIHLNGEGYAVWGGVIQPYIES